MCRKGKLSSGQPVDIDGSRDGGGCREREGQGGGDSLSGDEWADEGESEGDGEEEVRVERGVG